MSHIIILIITKYFLLIHDFFDKIKIIFKKITHVSYHFNLLLIKALIPSGTLPKVILIFSYNDK